MEVQCDWCGATIRKWPSLVRARNFCDRACFGKYRSAYLVGEKAAHWKGGQKRDRGRVLIHQPSHPRANKRGYVYRYVLVAEEMLGRNLTPEEVVHHINGDEADDRPENLHVFPNQAEHARHHGYQRTPEQMQKMRDARS